MSTLKIDPAEQMVLDQVIAWRRLRMSWQAVGRSLGVTGEAARAKYESWIACAPSLASRLVAPSPRPKEVAAAVPPPPKAKRVPKGRPKPRTARSVAAPVDLTPELEAAAFEAARGVLGLSSEAAALRTPGWYRVRVLAAAGYALWKWRPKTVVAKAFGVHGSMLAPSGMARRALTDAMVADVRKAMWASGFKP